MFAMGGLMQNSILADCSINCDISSMLTRDLHNFSLLSDISFPSPLLCQVDSIIINRHILSGFALSSCIL